MRTMFAIIVKPMFAVLVTIATILGTIFIENPRQQAMIVQASALEAIQYVKDYTNENPQQLTGSALAAFVSGAIWLSLFRMFGKHNVTQAPIDLPRDIEEQKPENPIVEKAKARALYSQLVQDRITLLGRQKRLPEEVANARLEHQRACSQVVQIENSLKEVITRRNDANRHLDRLLSEFDTQESDLVTIETEINRLQKLI